MQDLGIEIWIFKSETKEIEKHRAQDGKRHVILPVLSLNQEKFKFYYLGSNSEDYYNETNTVLVEVENENENENQEVVRDKLKELLKIIVSPERIKATPFEIASKIMDKINRTIPDEEFMKIQESLGKYSYDVPIETFRYCTPFKVPPTAAPKNLPENDRLDVFFSNN